MAKEVKFGTWLFSINNNQKELQRALQESSSIMKTYIKKPILTLLFVAFSITTSWAQSPLAYLEQTYPQLTELYREELIKYPAHYIFAVDVSGTMNQYSGFVLQALRPFFQALPDNDRVDVIPFGTEALPNMLSYCGVINSDVRGALNQNIGNLYTDPSYQQGFKGYTDIPKAVNAIAKVIQNNRDYKVNVVVLLTDFRNDVKGDSPSERKLNSQEINDLNTAICAATNNIYTRSIALELPVNKNMPGYCLSQLKEQVFPKENGGMEIVPLTNPGVMIGQWFEQLKRDIMVTKLKAVIDNANRLSPINLTTSTNIDGKVKAEVHWTPNKLYPTMQIDSTYMDGKDFVFENNKENFTQTQDSVLELDLGQIKHQSYGLHHLQDSINLGLKLPTPYDDELTSLGIQKPLPNTKKAEDRWIFTFFLPFWLTVVLAVLLLAYILLILKAIKRNASESFRGTVDIYDKVGRQIGNTIMVKCKGGSFLIGDGGTNGCQVNGAAWTVSVEKTTYSPLLVFKKPNFFWKAKKGFAKSGNKQRGYLGRYGNGKKLVNIECGSSYDAITNSITIRLNNK